MDDPLARFCEGEYPGLVGMLSLYCRDRFVAEELAQEALARACRDWRRVRGMERPDAWLRRVALNLAKSRSRRSLVERRVRGRLEAMSEHVHRDADAADSITVRQAISELSHQQKAVLILHYYGGLTFGQVAEELQLPEGTVKSIAHRAIHRLRHKLKLTDHKEAARVD